jgi:uncharacterized membrane protein YgdD (TMEM256/DUF423 family)
MPALQTAARQDAGGTNCKMQKPFGIFANDMITRMRLLGILGTLGLFFGVAFGAFGAHALKSHWSETALTTFETGVRYQMYHSIAILIAATLVERGSLFQTAGFLYLAGIILFCFSLYLLAWSGIRWLGAITPLGGLCFLAGHLTFLFAFLKLHK